MSEFPAGLIGVTSGVVVGHSLSRIAHRGPWSSIGKEGTGHGDPKSSVVSGVPRGR